MANTIALAQQYLTFLDRVYRKMALTQMLEAPAFIKQAGLTAKTIRLPKVTTDGLKNYSRADGFQTGNNTFEYETHTYSIDRGITFIVDKADDMETINTAFAFFTEEFMRVQMVPEIDAYRIATIAGRATGSADVEQNITATNALQAWDLAMEYFGDTEVPKERLVAFVTPTYKRFLKQSDLIERQFMTQMGGMMLNREVNMLEGIMLQEVPQNRMYTGITLQDGNNSGYIKTPTTARDVNFMIVDTMAGLADKKIDNMRIFTPETYQDAHAWKFDYRVYHDIFTPDNKIPGIYVNHKTT